MCGRWVSDQHDQALDRIQSRRDPAAESFDNRALEIFASSCVVEILVTSFPQPFNEHLADQARLS